MFGKNMHFENYTGGKFLRCDNNLAEKQNEVKSYLDHNIRQFTGDVDEFLNGFAVHEFLDIIVGQD